MAHISQLDFNLLSILNKTVTIIKILMVYKAFTNIKLQIIFI